MKIPKRLSLYLIKSFILPYLAITFLVIFIYILQEFIAEGTYLFSLYKTPSNVGKYFFYKIPFMFYQTYPICLLFAIIYVFSSLNVTDELIAIYSCGISPLQLAIPVLIFALLMTGIIVGLQDYYRVSSNKKLFEMELKAKNKEVSYDNSNIAQEGTDNKLIYVGRYDDDNKSIHNIYIVRYTRDKKLYYDIRADSAVYNKERTFWTFYNVVQTYYKKDGPVVLRWEEKVFEFKEGPEFFRNNIKDIEILKTKECFEYFASLKALNLVDYKNEVYFWNRFSEPVAGVIISIFGILAGTYFRKNVLVISLLTSIVVFGIYLFLKSTAFDFGQRGLMSPFMASWIGNVLFSFLGVYSIIKLSR